MSKLSEFSQCLVDKFVVTQEEADKFVKELLNIIRERLETDKIVKVRGLGTFKLTEMSPRESIAINSGERIVIEGRYKFTFTPENAVRDRINSPFAQFESIDIDDDMAFDAIDDKYNSMKEPEPAAAEQVETKPNPTEPVAAEPVGASPIPAPEPETPVVEAPETVAPVQEEAAPIVEEAPSPAEETPSPAEEEAPKEDETAPAAIEPLITPESDPVLQDNTECEELMRESVSHSRTIVHLLYGILALVAVGLLVVAGYFCYQLYSGVGESLSGKPTDNTPAPPTELATAATDTLTNASESAPTDVPADSVAPAAATVAPQPAAPPAETPDPQQAIYNKDTRVRTGAYVITGLDTTVTVLAGQTFRGICKAYLGEGMECYVEVFNDGMKTAEAGDKIKIPKLKLKKRLKKR